MNKKTKDYVIQKMKWPISYFDYISNYFVLFMPLFLIYAGIANYEKDGPFLISWGFVILIFFILRIEIERRFKALVLVKDYSTDEIGKLLQKNNWILSGNGDGILEFHTNASSFSWGQKVTIIKVSREKILINTLPAGRAPFTFFKDILNYKVVKRILEE
ncbi:hypothetical protein [Flavobacterium sp. YJ01]|uniref:hypothetical protein n=1 Tax=unclassified Flavobacterium TaxID=196869 RepID=UPI0023E4469A|nr:hypothetical protein [Flavobacterium sp. YJ01]WET02165.1 hypothetical protein P0R33_20655 [Flavobacterium sp. YJ01]